MSRETMAGILIGEIYAATAHDFEHFRPMDPRRVKRLANIYTSTIWDDAETINRLVGAGMNSRAFRARKRSPIGRLNASLSIGEG